MSKNNSKKVPKKKNSKKVPKKKNSKKMSKTKMMKIDVSSSSNQSSHMPKTRKAKIENNSSSNQLGDMPEPKKAKIEKSSASIQSTSRQNVPKPLLMDTDAVDFANIRNQPAFLDKTMLITAVLGVESRILLLAPRRFGKSINMSMLKRFFELSPNREEMKKNRKLFEDTEIGKCSEIMREHQGKYPILHLDFKSHSTVSSLANARGKISKIVQKAFNDHEYLASASSTLDDREKEIIDRWCKRDFEKNPVTKDIVIFEALGQLVIFLSKFWKKEVIVLTDDYDWICSDACLKIQTESELQKVIALCQGTLSCILKSSNTNINIARGILTGISDVMKMGLSKLNNVTAYKFQGDHRFSEFYGITEKELDFLLKKFKLTKQLQEVVEYYNGYRHEMLNICSVMHYLNRKVLDNYWKYSGTVSKLSEACGTLNVRSIVLKLLSGISNTVEFRFFPKMESMDIRDLKTIFEEKDPHSENTDVFFNFLLQQGLLSIVDIHKRGEGYMETIYVEAKIPNREIAAEFKEKLELFYTGVYHINFHVLKRCSLSFDEFGFSDEENVKYVSELFENLQGLFKTITFDIINEDTFHHVMCLVTLYCKGKCYSEIHRWNPDILDLIIFYNKGVGIIIELKIDEPIVKGKKNIKYADAGLHQILEKKYIEAFKNDKYNPKRIDVKYRVLMGIHIKSADKSISLSVLLNNLDYSKKINFPEMESKNCFRIQ